MIQFKPRFAYFPGVPILIILDITYIEFSGQKYSFLCTCRRWLTLNMFLFYLGIAKGVFLAVRMPRYQARSVFKKFFHFATLLDSKAPMLLIRIRIWSGKCWIFSFGGWSHKTLDADSDSRNAGSGSTACQAHILNEQRQKIFVLIFRLHILITRRFDITLLLEVAFIWNIFILSNVQPFFFCICSRSWCWEQASPRSPTTSPTWSGPPWLATGSSPLLSLTSLGASYFPVHNQTTWSEAVFRNRIRSGFNQVSGSGFGIRIRNPDPDPAGQKWPTKVEKN